MTHAEAVSLREVRWVRGREEKRETQSIVLLLRSPLLFNFTISEALREIFAERIRIGCSSVPPAYTCLFLPTPYRDEALQHGIGDCALRHGKELGVREHGVFSFKK